jgi:hypothetical protein
VLAALLMQPKDSEAQFGVAMEASSLIVTGNKSYTIYCYAIDKD